MTLTGHPDEDRFIRGIAAEPEDEALRLVYSDWLEEHGHAARAAYLRAEAKYFKSKSKKKSDRWSKAKGVDLVWVNMVSRPPFGILRPGLTFSECGPAITLADIKSLEARWGQPLPADYAAFLLLHNGGRPSLPYLWSYEEAYDEDGKRDDFDVYAELRLFGLGEKDKSKRRHHISAVDLSAYPEDDARFAQMMWIGTLTYEYADADDEVNPLFLLMDPSEKYERYIELCYHGSRLHYADEVNNQCDFISLLCALTDNE